MIDIKTIEDRQHKLLKVSKKLKKDFIGIDAVIDKIMGCIEAWYVMPEILSRPVIVNLWGLTGVGKTDLVRKLATYLDFSTKFAEIQLNNKGSEHSSVQSDLFNLDIRPQDQAILLLDEIQRFRTLDERGFDISTGAYKDIWMLLSDGSFGNNPLARKKVVSYLLDKTYRLQLGKFSKQYVGEIASNSPVPQPLSYQGEDESLYVQNSGNFYKMDVYDAESIRNMLRTNTPIEEIMTWTSDDVVREAKKYLKKMSTDDNSRYSSRYSKLLIFVSGNLDDVYSMSDNCSDNNSDADIFYENSLKINMIHIKDSLKLKFKPEQIARLGNVHIIYPSLSKKSYNGIINKSIRKISAKIKSKAGVTLKFDKTIKDFIYRNGVFPAQGTRPLFSTVSMIIERLVPAIVLKLISSGYSGCFITYNCKSKNIDIYTEQKGNKIFNMPCDGDIDTINSSVNCNTKIMLSIHEAGHAVVFAKLNNLPPKQIVASSTQSSFVFPNKESLITKSDMINDIAICLAGGLSEIMVFGEDNLTPGWSGDLARATAIATDYVRRLGFGSELSLYSTDSTNTQANINGSRENGNEIEVMIQRGRHMAMSILENNKKLLRDVGLKLYENGKLSKDEFVNICKSNNFNFNFNISEQDKYNRNLFKDIFKDFSRKIEGQAGLKD